MPTTDHAAIALQQAQQTIALLQTYVAALGGTIAVMGGFFGFKWIGAMIDNTKSNTDYAASNREMADALKALAQAVANGKE